MDWIWWEANNNKGAVLHLLTAQHELQRLIQRMKDTAQELASWYRKLASPGQRWCGKLVQEAGAGQEHSPTYCTASEQWQQAMCCWLQLLCGQFDGQSPSVI